jgi:hypothetical protein
MAHKPLPALTGDCLMLLNAAFVAKARFSATA